MVPSDPVMIQALQRQRTRAIWFAMLNLLLCTLTLAHLTQGFDPFRLGLAITSGLLVILPGLRAVHLTAQINGAVRNAS